MHSDDREDWELTPDELNLKRVEMRKRQNFLDETLNCQDLPKPTSKLWHLVSGLGLAGFLVGRSLGSRDYSQMKVYLQDKFEQASREADRHKDELERISREYQQYKEKISREYLQYKEDIAREHQQYKEKLKKAREARTDY